MNCEKCLNLIDDLIENELDEPIVEQINLHIFDCSQCAVQYQTLKEEKRIYNHYLFNIEPSKDLWLSLQQKLDAEPVKLPTGQKSFFDNFGWLENLISLSRLSTAFALALVLLVFGLGFATWKFVKLESSAQPQTEAAKIDFEENKLVPTVSPASRSQQTIALPVKDLSNEKRMAKEKNARVLIVAKQAQPSLPRSSKLIKQPVLKKENLPANSLPNKEQMLAQMQLLEKDAANQIEKIELLLRSFRNARVIEGSEIFDTSYEKQQARNLLEKNVRLRQIAEIYGDAYTEELLDKAESFLLDIANLENNPLPEKVIRIKERVKNQNIIASLQTY